MKHSSLLVFLGITLIGGGAYAQQEDFSKVTIKTTKLAEGLYMLEGSGGNIGVSVGDDGVIVVDDQFAPLTPKIQEAISRIMTGATKTGKPVCILADGLAEAKAFAALGATAFIVASDQGFMKKAAHAAVTEFATLRK